MTDKVEDRGDHLQAADHETVDPKAEEAKAAEAKAAEEKAAADAKAAEDAKTAEEKAAAEKAEREKDIRIPKSRMDEAVKKARAEAETAHRALAEANAKLKAAEGSVDAAKIEARIGELEEELDKAVADNDKTQIKQLRTDIRSLERVLSDSRAEAKAAYATAVAVEQVRYDAVVQRMEMEHPELNPEEEDTYDQEKVDEVLELKEAFEAKGLGSSESLKKSLGVLYRGAPAPDKKPEQSEAEKKAAKEKADAEAAKRKEEAVKKGLDAKGKQPADNKAVGADADKAGKAGDPAAEAAKMSDREFDKLTPEELARARGDIV